jgi:hypothetical protein
MILLLMVWVAEEYNYNGSFQGQVTSSFGMFGYLFGGTLVAIYAGMLMVLYLNPPMRPATR